MKKFLFFFLVILCYSVTTFAQSFYVGNITYTESGFPVGNVHRITITPSGVTSQLLNTCSAGYFFSLGMNKNGVYWFDGPIVYKGDLIGDDITNCKQIATIQYGSNSLTTGADGSLYYVEEQIKKLNPETGVITNLGVPNYFPSGDITFYNNDLYMAADVGIVKVNSQNPGNSTVVIDTHSYGSLFGLVSVATDLHKNTIYGLVYINENRTDILELDLDNNKAIGIIGSLPYAVLDAASPTENGSISGIKIDKINLHQDCNAPTKGVIEVITSQHDDSFTYTLNTGQSNSTGVFTNLPAGNYTVTVKSSNDLQTGDITLPAYQLTKPVYTFKIKNQGCDADGEIVFESGNTAYGVKLGADVFPINHAFTGLVSGQNYHFEFINEWGCTADVVDLAVPKDKCTIQFDKTVITKECSSAANGNLQVLTKPHSLAYTYSLDASSNTTGIFNQLAPGNYTLKITSAQDELIVPVTIPDFKQQHAAITYSATDAVCSDKGTVQFSVNDDMSLYRVKFNGSTYPLNYNFNNLDKGIYHFIISTQADCLVDEYDVEIKYQPCPIVITQITNRPECDVFSKGFVQVFVDPIPEILSYQLNGTINKTGVFGMLDPGTYQLTVTSSGGGTPQTQTIIVQDYKLTHPTINYVALNPACKDKGTVTFTIADDVNLYRVRFGANIFPMDHLFTDLTPGPNHFTVVTATGCLVDEYDINLEYQPCAIVINNIDVTAECNILGKGVVQVRVEPIPEDLTYKLENTTNTTGVFNFLQPGTYQLTVTASGGSAPQTRNIIVPDYTAAAPHWTITQANPVCDIPGTVQITPSGVNGDYNIGYNSAVYPASHVFKDLYAGTYHFTVLKKDNCMAAELDVTMVEEICSPVSFPNAFTPNQDGTNDIFRADPQSKASNYRLQIFDRWGTQVFVSTSLASGWDGNYRGKQLAAGVYYWIANYTTQENKPALQKGSVTLLR